MEENKYFFSVVESVFYILINNVVFPQKHFEKVWFTLNYNKRVFKCLQSQRVKSKFYDKLKMVILCISHYFYLYSIAQSIDSLK